MKKFIFNLILFSVLVLTAYSQDTQCDPCCIKLSAKATLEIAKNGYLINQPYIIMDCNNCVHSTTPGCTCAGYGYGICLKQTSNPTNSLPISPKNVTMNNSATENWGCNYCYQTIEAGVNFNFANLTTDETDALNRDIHNRGSSIYNNVICFDFKVNYRRCDYRSCIKTVCFSIDFADFCTDYVKGSESTIDSFEISPNPTNNNLKILLTPNRFKSTVIILFDIYGRIVYNNTFSSDNTEVTIDTRQFSSGIYCVQVSYNTDSGLKIHNKKVIIIK